MNKVNKVEIIKTCLQTTFSPTHLEVLDESADHVGHAGYQGGGKHFAIIISASCFAGVSRVEAHQQIYAALSELLVSEIHALRIKVLQN